MLIATIRKKRPWLVGSSSAGGATSVTLSGRPCWAATGVKIFCTTVAVVSEPAVATISSGAAFAPAPLFAADAPSLFEAGAPPPGPCASITYAPKISWCFSWSSASARLPTVRTSRPPCALSLIDWASTCVWEPEPTTATGRWCGSGCANAPR